MMETLFKSLFSKYIIDGVMMDSTPADMLMECFAPEDWERLFPAMEQTAYDETIVDETVDMDPSPLKYEFSKMEAYFRQLRGEMSAQRRGSVSLRHPTSSARLNLAETVLWLLLSRRPLRLEGLSLTMSIHWDCGPVGNMAAFHKAVEAVSGYAYDLGIRFTGLDFAEVAGSHEMDFAHSEFMDDRSMSYGSDDGPHSNDLTDPIPGEVTDCGGILIYVPFDTCPHKLGGSLFSGMLGGGDELGPEIFDPDYFMDSYEVVQDLVEDGVALSGTVVGRGGLITAVVRLLGEKFVIDMDLGGIQKTYMEDDPVRILFSEIPGVVLQISDADRDYVDSQFLLQDIAYYPLGRPVVSNGSDRKIRLSVESRDDLSRLLSSLLDGQKPEDPEISNFAGE